MRPVIAPGLVGLMLCGCAGLSGDECGSPDWAQLGQRDGRMGVQSQLEHYAARCGPGFRPDAARYQEGLQAGFSLRPPPNW